MSLNEEDKKSIEANVELQEKIKQLWNDGASAQEFRDALSAEGINVDLDSVEGVLNQLQAQKGDLIATDDLDIDMLKKVAGGGSGIDCSSTGDCDKHFKESMYLGADKCAYSEFCDEYTTTLCNVDNATLL